MGLSPVKLPPQALQPNPFTQVRFAAQDADKPPSDKPPADPPETPDRSEQDAKDLKNYAKVFAATVAGYAAIAGGAILANVWKSKKKKEEKKPKDDDDKKPGGKK